GAHLYGFLGLLRGLSWVLTLHQGLVNDTGGLACRDGLAAFERAGAGTAGGQESQREPGAKKGGEVVHGGRLPPARAFSLPARIQQFSARDLGRAGLGRRRRSIGADGVAGPQRADVLAPLLSSRPSLD